jgi:hypothetical protein
VLDRGVNVAPDVRKELVVKRVNEEIEQNTNSVRLKEIMNDITELVKTNIIKS